MSVQLQVRLDAKDLARLAVVKGKAKTAAAKALTFTAQDSQLALKGQVPGVFHLRNGWVPKGVRLKSASAGSMSARVGSVDKYMERHVIGAGKPKPPERALTISKSRDSRGRLSSGGLMIMPYGGIGEYPTHTAVSRKLKRVGGQKRKTFNILSKSGNQVLIVRRKSKKRTPLQVLGILRGEAVDIKQEWDMFGAVKGVVSARFSGHFERALGKL
ncbi:hypothetical protein PMNALOAF_2716 [Methylobacterium adhaesivum]|uniref:Phage tail protein n=1 Tax=Methylobacterium adhaesivum TaxID=333297 RepID=A0ABT8BKK0_9HYPH|nr:hypothetical protein [Methylobacterium adhaesivum]MDN3592070.1 hypothetical protein [Methylobacterium adhaesivum]GJD31457.1 hypothetical protein PMNALOAF_2716 [Methylobacterium adhaesivum]